MNKTQRNLKDAELSLQYATNMFGKLNRDLRERVLNAVENPTEENWDRAYSVIIDASGISMTLWKAVCEVDPTFPNMKSGESWDRIPDSDLLVEAIVYATH